MGTTARTNGVLRRALRRRPIFAILIVWALIGGCVHVPVSPGDGTVPPPGNGDGPATFVVSIQVSNPTPQLQEEVTFRCTTEGDVSEPLTFSFQAPDVALQVDPVNGTASFIVTESDVGFTFDVTCSVIDGEGRTVQSGRISVTPTE